MLVFGAVCRSVWGEVRGGGARVEGRKEKDSKKRESRWYSGSGIE